MSEDAFLDVTLEFQRASSPDRVVTEAYVLNNVTHGLKKLFGDSGASIPVDLLELKPKDKKRKELQLVLACPSTFVKRVRASLTLQGAYQGEPCAYHVNSVSDQAPDRRTEKQKTLRYF